jgi:hypothetical protein
VMQGYRCQREPRGCLAFEWVTAAAAGSRGCAVHCKLVSEGCECAGWTEPVPVTDRANCWFNGVPHTSIVLARAHPHPEVCGLRGQ